MAIIKLAAPLSGLRGTIAGVTYSANGSSLYAKQWARGPNPRSDLQSVERTYLARMPALWAALSDAQRAAWRTFAADPAQELTNSLGEAYYASGYNWFVKCNIRLLRVGRSTISAVPTQARPSAPTIDAFRVCLAGSESDLCTGGTPSASSADPAAPASNAFDNNTGTIWSTPAGTTTGWLQYVLTSSQIVREYTIFPSPTLTTNPANWTFERLDAGPTWTPIHTVTGESYAAATLQTYYCPNETASTTYRLNVTANQGHATRLQLAEMQYFNAAAGASVIIYPEDDFSASPSYDLILHIAQGATTARAFQYPGYAEILAQQSPGRWYATFQAALESAYGTIVDNRSWFARLYRQTQEGLRSAAQTSNTTTL